MPMISRARRAALLAALQITAAASLGGCAHTNTVLAQQAEEVFHSPQSANDVVACFEQLNHLRVIEREDGARVARFRNGYGGVVKTFSIYPDGPGSRIEMRSNFVGVPGIKWKRCVGLKPMKPRS